MAITCWRLKATKVACMMMFVCILNSPPLRRLPGWPALKVLIKGTGASKSGNAGRVPILTGLGYVTLSGKTWIVLSRLTVSDSSVMWRPKKLVIASAVRWPPQRRCWSPCVCTRISKTSYIECRTCLSTKIKVAYAKDNASTNTAIIRHAALNMIRQAQKKRVSIKHMRKAAGRDNSILTDILAQVF